METDNKNKRTRLLYVAVITLLVLIFVLGFFYGLNSVLKMEGTFPPAVLTESISPVPASKEDALEYLNRVTSDALEGKPEFSSKTTYDIDEDSLETNGSLQFTDSLLYLQDDFTDSLEDGIEKHSANFGEGFDGYLKPPAFTADMIEDFSCEYIYYKCISCDKTSGEPQSQCEYCGSAYPYQMNYRDDYTLTLKLFPDEEFIIGNFVFREESEIFGSELDGIADITDFSVDYNALTVKAVINRETDELKSLVFTKDMTVNVKADFLGGYSDVGSVSVSVNASQNDRYSFTWPGIELNVHSLDMELKGNDNLIATLICDIPTDYEAAWETSDESVVTVDDEGYLKAGKSAGTAVITASYEYQGKKYSDSCVINVKQSVESLSLNKKKISLNVGDTFALTAAVSPKDATVQSVTWYSDDESIVTVDENGVVTAVGSGIVTVYALSDDLYYKSSCEVTVK